MNVFEYFLGLDGIKEGNIYLDKAGAEKRPDCYVKFLPNKNNFKELAIEVELNQKTYARIEDKFLDYLRLDSYDLVLYLIQKTATFEAYKRAMDRVDYDRDPLKRKLCRDKIILMIEPEIKHKVFNLMESICYFEGRIEKFKDIYKRLIIPRDKS